MTRPAGAAALRQIVDDAQATLLLPRYTGAPPFAAQLLRLQTFQSGRMRQTHLAWYAHPADALLLGFIVDEVYRGIDLTPLKGRLTSAERLLGALFDDFELVQVAVAFTAITSSLDDELAPWFANSAGLTDDLAYANAVRVQNRLADRATQNALLLRFTRMLSGLLDDPVAWRAIKLAKLPAQLAGLGGFHTLVSNGFAAMSSVHDAGAKVEQLIAVESAYFATL